jgi:hypothetical protein
VGTQLLENRCGVSHFAAGAAEFLGDDQCRRTDLVAERRPQRLVVTALGIHGPADGFGAGLFGDEGGDGLA